MGISLAIVLLVGAVAMGYLFPMLDDDESETNLHKNSSEEPDGLSDGNHQEVPRASKIAIVRDGWFVDRPKLRTRTSEHDGQSLERAILVENARMRARQAETANRPDAIVRSVQWWGALTVTDAAKKLAELWAKFLRDE